MTYQIGMFDPGGECWRFYREDYKIVAFDTLSDAEAEATAMSIHSPGCEFLVLTSHTCIKTDVEYPPPAPIVRTRRIDIKTTPPVAREINENVKRSGTSSQAGDSSN